MNKGRGAVIFKHQGFRASRARAARRISNVKLHELGWNGFVAAEWKSTARQGERPARVIAQHRELWDVAGEFGDCRAEASGKLRLAADEGADWPAVGDWVSVSREPGCGMTIRQVLPRRTQIARKVAGRRVTPQVLAANVDTLFLMMGMDGDYNPRRLERYLAQAWESGARVVVLLNKADICEDTEARRMQICRIATGADVLCVSAATGAGVTQLDKCLESGQTVVLLGSSGVGKSTLVNRLLERDEQPTSPVRASDSRGRHTTTARQLFFLRGGAIVIDTPGLRELQLWDSEAGLDQAFGDVEALAKQCRFRDCKHSGEPGCAVTAAVREGELEQERLENHRKLLREHAFLERKIDKGAQQKARNQIKITNRAVRELYRRRERDGKE
jgi:ribosome biogenesis GTPase / thiamine phosphate phosphatase